MAREQDLRKRAAGDKDRKMDWRAISGESCFRVIDDTGIKFTAIQRRVSAGMATAAKSSRFTRLEAVGGVVRGALRGALVPGADALMGVKAIVTGVIWGAGVKKDAALKVLSHATRTMIRQAAGRNGDVGSVVTGLVCGAIECAGRMGVSTSIAAEAVVSVAVEEVYRIGSIEAPWVLPGQGRNDIERGERGRDRRRRAARVGEERIDPC